MAHPKGTHEEVNAEYRQRKGQGLCTCLIRVLEWSSLRFLG